MKMLKNKRALSTVVTTLIILVVSVLLATVVTFYAINVTTTRVQEEYLQITNLHVWRAENTTPAVAAFVITNTGGRDVVIEKITVRGVQAQGNNIYYRKVDIVADPLPKATPPEDGSGYTKLGDKALILPSGERIEVYIFGLSHISTSDIGVTVSVTVFTANAQYHKETNIEAMP
ncbi:MAG: hypothetical protein QXJ77_03465 [Candidatus Bathyarchaeia archaeon]